MYMLIFTDTYESEVGDSVEDLIIFGESTGTAFVIVDAYEHYTVFDSSEDL